MIDPKTTLETTLKHLADIAETQVRATVAGGALTLGEVAEACRKAFSSLGEFTIADTRVLRPEVDLNTLADELERIYPAIGFAPFAAERHVPTFPGELRRVLREGPPEIHVQLGFDGPYSDPELTAKVRQRMAQMRRPTIAVVVSHRGREEFYQGYVGSPVQLVECGTLGVGATGDRIPGHITHVFETGASLVLWIRLDV